MKHVPARLLALGFGALAITSTLSLDSCRQDPLGIDTVFVHDTVWHCPGRDSANLLINGAFNLSSTGTHDLGYNEMVGWNPYKGTPQAAAGYGSDGQRGYIQMWGNGDSSLGEGITQHLAAPMMTGVQYQVSCDLAWLNDNPDNYTQYTRVRFIAYNMYGQSTTIGTVQTSSTSWTHMTTAPWTADAIYTDFAIVVEDDNVGTNSACWAHIDNVVLSTH